MVESIKIITDNDLCISCGACKHICPFNNIEMQYNHCRGKWDAEVNNTDICRKCNGKKTCLYVCPSYEMDYMTLFGSDENGLLGKIQDVYNGYSTNKSIRHNSSSGGFIRELCNSLMDNHDIDGIIGLTHLEGMEYAPSLTSETSKLVNSIYHNVNYENAFDILQKNNGKYLLIGLPCQITSIENLFNKPKYSYLRGRVFAKVALICGYSFDRINAQALALLNNIELHEISYRGKGKYRKTRVSDRFRSTVYDVVRPKSLHEHINNKFFFDKYLVQYGCLYCVDHLGYAADLVVGDAWQKRYKDDKVGTNIIICRTENGAAALSRTRNFHFETGFNNEIVESQSNLYALGSLGEAMKNIQFKHKTFSPNHLRTKNMEDIIIYKLKWSERIKVKIVKKLLKERRFKLARLLYEIVDFKNLLVQWMIINYMQLKSLK